MRVDSDITWTIYVNIRGYIIDMQVARCTLPVLLQLLTETFYTVQHSDIMLTTKYIF